MKGASKRRRSPAAPTRPAPRTPNGLIPLVLCVATLLLFAGGLLAAMRAGAPMAPTVGGHWSLTRGDGATVTDRDFRGRYVLLYFGYTRCPDVCPTTLDAVADAMRRLGRAADRLQPLFVTVDPGHDTPAVVHAYVTLFDARLVGLTGTPAQIAGIERAYRISSRVTEPGTASGGPAIDHTAVLLLLGPDGRYVAPIPADETGRSIADRLRGYLS